ncbi:hypothetical protein [Flavobacterium sp. YO12]|uniref:hypothetical protein n=1 Tax=Flavobacterium sp. YO12 TaxID=1920029 RepID=UPI00100B9945|nr:hypothetical protein [Flavobacterium sp. YO12]
MRKTITVFMILGGLFINASKADTIAPLEKKTQKKDLIKKLLNADYNKPSKASEGVKDITGLTFGGGNSASIPEEYREVAVEYNWNPNAMTPDEMEKEYNLIMKKKYLRWTYLTIGIISLLSSIKFIRTITK